MQGQRVIVQAGLDRFDLGGGHGLRTEQQDAESLQAESLAVERCDLVHRRLEIGSENRVKGDAVVSDPRRERDGDRAQHPVFLGAASVDLTPWAGLMLVWRPHRWHIDN